MPLGGGAFEKVGVQAVVDGFKPYMRDIGKMEGATKGFGANVGKFLKMGALAGGAALVGLGAAALKLGGEFDKAYDNIRVGTGATGEAFEGLKKDFRTALKDVPADMGDVSIAVADLNTRLGLTGKPLQKMTKQMVELSRITKTDLSTNIEAVTRLFGDWSVATEDQSECLDDLFRTSQATGVGVDRLSQLVVEFGAPLRAFGFTLDESTALLAKFEKEGVNTEAVMAGLKIGLGKIAAAGKDPVETFREVAEAILNAGSAGEANIIALETFGSRAGPDMAAAIREGRFELDDFIAQMEEGGDGILETAEATESWTEKLKILKNKGLVALEPVLLKVFDGMTKLLDFIEKEAIPTIGDIVAGIADFVGWLERNKELLGLVAGAITILLIPAVAEMTRHVWANVTALGAQSVAMAAANPLVMAILASVGLLGAAYVATDKQGRKMALSLLREIGELEAGVFHAVLGPFGIDPLFGRIIERIEGMEEEAKEYNQLQKDVATGSAKWADQTLGDLQAMISEGEELGLTVEQIELAQLEKMAQELANVGQLMTDQEIGPIWSAAMEEVMRSTGLSADEIDKLVDRAVELSGASEEGGEVIREQLTAAIEGMQLPSREARDDLVELVGAAGDLPEPVDEAAEAFTTFQEDVDTALEGVGEAIKSVLPTIDEEFAAWDERLAEMATAYTDFQTNLETILGALLTAHVEQPELIIQALADAGPGVTQAMATHLAENPITAVDTTLANLGIVVGTNIDAAEAAVLQQTPAFQAQMETLAAASVEGADEEMAGLEPVVAENLEAGRAQLVRKIPGYKEAMFTLANQALVGFVRGFYIGPGESLADFITRQFEAAQKASRLVLRASSPSKVFADIGRDIRLGLELGLSGGSHQPGLAEAVLPRPQAEVVREAVLAPSVAPQAAAVAGGGVDPNALAAAVASALQGVTVVMDGREVGSLVSDRLGDRTSLLGRGG